jgi:threonylcarbamoyladenosine tRNA methylthiotransferase MtaB
MQSGSDRILAAMKRKYNTEIARRGIALLREALPDVQFTTDMIVGFPGETEEDFARTLDFAREIGFLMIHVFPYSKRQGTPAAVMPDQVPGEIKKQRVAALSALSADIRREILTGLIEKKTILPVLFETYTEGTAVGHTPNFIEVHVPVPTSLHAQTHNVRLVALTEDGTGCIGQLC